LRATVLFTIHYIDSQHADSKFSLQHEFIDEPIFVLHDADLPERS